MTAAYEAAIARWNDEHGGGAVTTPENRAKGMGMIGAAFGLGFIFGPAIGGILSRWGIHVPFIFAGALSAAGSG